MQTLVQFGSKGETYEPHWTDHRDNCLRITQQRIIRSQGVIYLLNWGKEQQFGKLMMKNLIISVWLFWIKCSLLLIKLSKLKAAVEEDETFIYTLYDYFCVKVSPLRTGNIDVEGFVILFSVHEFRACSTLGEINASWCPNLGVNRPLVCLCFFPKTQKPNNSLLS